MQMLHRQTPSKQPQDPHARWVCAAPTALRCHCCDRDPALTLRLHSGQAGWAKLWRASSALGRFGALWASWSLGLAESIYATRHDGKLAAWNFSKKNLSLRATRLCPLRDSYHRVAHCSRNSPRSTQVNPASGVDGVLAARNGNTLQERGLVSLDEGVALV